jgi:hypothetical protein
LGLKAENLWVFTDSSLEDVTPDTWIEMALTIFDDVGSF